MGDPFTLGEDEFWEMFKPLDNPQDRSCIWEFSDTLTHHLSTVWTLIDGDEDNNQYAVPGYHVVNKFGYCVTEVPWTKLPDGVEQALWIDWNIGEDSE
jgi:hypothetical protein